MVDDDDNIKITDLSIVSINADDCSNYVIAAGANGNAGWVNYKADYTFSNTLSLYGKDGAAVEINFHTGDLTIASHMTVDEAAKLFWDRVLAMNPLQHMPIPDNVKFEYQVEDNIVPLTRTFVPESCKVEIEIEREKINIPSYKVKTPEESALEAYTRAMKVVG